MNVKLLILVTAMLFALTLLVHFHVPVTLVSLEMDSIVKVSTFSVLMIRISGLTIMSCHPNKFCSGLLLKGQ